MKDARSYRVSPNITSVLALSKEGHEMFIGLQGQKIMYTTSFVGKICRKNPGFDKGKTAGIFGLTV